MTDSIPSPDRLRAWSIPALFALVLCVAGCSDDDSGPDGPPLPQETTVHLTVVDSDGQPLPGRAVALCNHTTAQLELDPLLAGAAGKASVTIPFAVAESCIVTMTIHDVEGEQILELASETMDPGQHSWLWNGHDGPWPDGEHLPGGHYLVRMSCTEPSSGTQLFSAERVMAMVVMDPRQHSFGVTDADGRITISGRTLFPGFYDLDDMMQVDAAGDPLGTFRWLESVLIAVEGPEHERIFARDIRPGENDITLTWPTTTSTGGASANEIGDRRVADRAPRPGGPERSAQFVPFELGQPYPNPFN
ncbi:MAG: hypothetical protein R6X25_02050 [Candidatus Krumholzibacteriia bacterium]